jgi:hypothetical protein
MSPRIQEGQLATRTITTKQHNCDLCGGERQEDGLAHLYGAPAWPSREGPRVDICGECQARPVADVLALLAKAARAARVQLVNGTAEFERSPEEIAELKARLARLEDEREQTG